MTASNQFWTERSVPGSPSWPFFRGRFLARYRYAFPFATGGAVLDVACGAGYGSYLLATDGGARQVTGVDISGEAVAYAREHYGEPHLRFRVGNGQDVAGMGPFYLVTSMGTLEHVENPQAFVAAVASVMTPKALWLVTMLNQARHDSRDPFHHQELEAPELRGLLEGGFSDVTLLGLHLRETGEAKQRRNASRLAPVPAPLKRLAKAVIGPALTWKISLAGALTYEAEDYLWTPDDLGSSIEFLGVCRRPR